MMIDHLRKILDEIAELPEEQQEKYATELERDLREQQRIAAQLADPKATDLDYLLAEADREIASGQIYDLDVILDEGQ